MPPAPRLNGRSPAPSPWRATFVSLIENERLPDCIGWLAPRRLLIDDAIANGAQPSFAAGLRLDVSIPSHRPPIPVGSESELVKALELDRNGLILGAGKRRALFLPSVGASFPMDACLRHLIETGWPMGLEAMGFRVESFGAPWRRSRSGRHHVSDQRDSAGSGLREHENVLRACGARSPTQPS